MQLSPPTLETQSVTNITIISALFCKTPMDLALRTITSHTNFVSTTCNPSLQISFYCQKQTFNGMTTLLLQSHPVIVVTPSLSPNKSPPTASKSTIPRINLEEPAPFLLIRWLVAITHPFLIPPLEDGRSLTSTCVETNNSPSSAAIKSATSLFLLLDPKLLLLNNGPCCENEESTIQIHASNSTRILMN